MTIHFTGVLHFSVRNDELWICDFLLSQPHMVSLIPASSVSSHATQHCLLPVITLLCDSSGFVLFTSLSFILFLPHPHRPVTTVLPSTSMHSPFLGLVLANQAEFASLCLAC